MVLLKLSAAQEAMSAWWGTSDEVTKSPEASGAIPGLANLGNTCFANSVLQCVLNTPGWFPEACNSFDKFDDTRFSKKAALGRSFASLAKEYGAHEDSSLKRSNSALKSMKDAIAAIDPQYAGCQQQDAYEFLGCLLEGLEESFGALFHQHGEEKPSPSPAVIRAICGCTTLTRRACHSCKGCFDVDRVTDTALRLPLVSPAAQFDAVLREKEEETPITLQALLEAAQQPETIEGYDCDACRKCAGESNEEHQRSTITQHANVISATRDVVIVVLYRFAQALDGAGNFKPVKVKRQVACPSELSLDSGKYSLFGAVSHLGTSLSAGHYVAAVKSRRDDVWYECNDERVTPLTLKALYDGRPVTSFRAGAEPYILFYHRQQASTDGLSIELPLKPAANVQNHDDASTSDENGKKSPSAVSVDGSVVDDDEPPEPLKESPVPASMLAPHAAPAAQAIADTELNAASDGAETTVAATSTDEITDGWVVVSLEESQNAASASKAEAINSSSVADPIDDEDMNDVADEQSRSVRRRLIEPRSVTPVTAQRRPLSAKLPKSTSCGMLAGAMRRGFYMLKNGVDDESPRTDGSAKSPTIETAASNAASFLLEMQACSQALP